MKTWHIVALLAVVAFLMFRRRPTVMTVAPMAYSQVGPSVVSVLASAAGTFAGAYRAQVAGSQTSTAGIGDTPLTNDDLENLTMH